MVVFTQQLTPGTGEHGCCLQQHSATGINFYFAATGCGADKMPVPMGVLQVWKASSFQETKKYTYTDLNPIWTGILFSC